MNSTSMEDFMLLARQNIPVMEYYESGYYWKRVEDEDQERYTLIESEDPQRNLFYDAKETSEYWAASNLGTLDEIFEEVGFQSINAALSCGLTPLAVACFYRDRDLVQWFLDHEIYPDGLFPFSIVLGNDVDGEAVEQELYQRFLRNQSFNPTDFRITIINGNDPVNYREPLAEAIISNSMTICNMLIGKGFPLRIETLIQAAKFHDGRRLDCFEYFLRKGLNDRIFSINDTDFNGDTLLMAVCYKNMFVGEEKVLPFVNLFLSLGANPNHINSKGDSCLNIALSSGENLRVFEALINGGAIITAKEIQTAKNSLHQTSDIDLRYIEKLQRQQQQERLEKYGPDELQRAFDNINLNDIPQTVVEKYRDVDKIDLVALFGNLQV